ncbi:GNAT family N-acetyltransferase [Jiangella alkaliphila]|uniref:Acetyltransferase (GNAT) family protein n=1 Tax=Jiangella alkaliphila TaxID=419479 RepID=A0A1H2IAE1_9ACTN|nr:GNAT family N-acetyltransferase [Jiangella alkaliphila]SDU41064.1 Acetyltransferase (GNAT) family protein [Jiangella alkaliphila]
MIIRPYEPADTDALYDICLRTGDNGGDATALFADPRLIGELFVGPYVRYEPSLAFVVDDGAPAGYVLGARDTVTFEQRCEREWWPPLREKYPPGSFPDGTRDAYYVERLHESRTADPAIVAEYPAHLHIDLLPRTQGRGMGRALMERLLAALHEAGAPAVHLGVGAANTRAIAFYERMGFATLRQSPNGRTMGRPTS